jgi:cytochrome c oxidase assembly factor CtaG
VGPSPSLRSVALDWSFDPGALVLAALAGGLYAAGVRRLAARRRRWPAARSAAFGTGLAVLVVATCSGLGRHEEVRFSIHALQHALLGLVAPLLVALGAPVTLDLQASSRATRTAVLRIVHSRPATFLAHPIPAWLVFGGTVVALYTTPLLEASTEHDAVHAAVHLHVLAAGVWFCWVTVGVDPVRRRPSHPVRLLAVLAALPFHTVVGLALVGSDQLLAPGAYPDLGDQHAGGGVLWASGEVFGLVASGIVLAQWMAHEERVARREDRRAAHARAGDRTLQL